MEFERIDDDNILFDDELYGFACRRHFKCLTSNDDNEVILKGRFAGKFPKQAALKAISKLYKACEDPVPDKIIFGMSESSRGSRKKKYFYTGARVALDPPQKVMLYNGKCIVHRYCYNVKRIRNIDKYNIKDKEDCYNPIFDYDD